MINNPKEGTIIKIKNLGVLWIGIVKNVYVHSNPKYPNVEYASIYEIEEVNGERKAQAYRSELSFFDGNWHGWNLSTAGLFSPKSLMKSIFKKER